MTIPMVDSLPFHVSLAFGRVSLQIMYRIIPLANARLILITTSEILLIIPPSKAHKPIGIEVIIDMIIRENVLRLFSLKKSPIASPSGIPCSIKAIAR